MEIAEKLDEIIKLLSILADRPLEAKRAKIREKFPNFKSGDLSSEVHARYSALLGGEPSIALLRQYCDAFYKNHVYKKSEIAEEWEWDIAQTTAFLYFAEAARLIESTVGGYRRAVVSRPFAEGPCQDLPYIESKTPTEWKV